MCLVARWALKAVGGRQLLRSLTGSTTWSKTMSIRAGTVVNGSLRYGSGRKSEMRLFCDCALSNRRNLCFVARQPDAPPFPPPACASTKSRCQGGVFSCSTASSPCAKVCNASSYKKAQYFQGHDSIHRDAICFRTLSGYIPSLQNTVPFDSKRVAMCLRRKRAEVINFSTWGGFLNCLQRTRPKPCHLLSQIENRVTFASLLQWFRIF
jgi:hypothetical protein